ncbi:hypothetical protein [Flavobacterium sp. U410]
MYEFENFIDEDLLNEDLLNEDLFGEDLLESFDESFDEAKRRPFNRRKLAPISSSVRPRVAQKSNFGKSLSGRAADYATKSDLKKALDSISGDVNELKKTSIATSKSIKALDAKHTELVKIEARKNENQKTVLKNMQMMSMMGSLINQPKLKADNLKIVSDDKGIKTIEEVTPGNSIQVDQTLSLLLPMMTTMGDSSTGKSDSSNMMLPMILLMSQNGNTTSGNNNLLPLVMMMTMMNK